MENQKPNEEPKKINNAIKYSAMGFQMFATIGLLTFIGYKIDEHRQSKTNIITALFALAGVAIALYQAIKQVTK
ncbi:AtpZ/AtpI family protein [Pedobacter changchengzhani]|uniref:AtpZ/AtpI family protein n=1 Tax=Pedobacter changchengzhani TaxID=2529274 RepID=A0A4R5MR39_9SPHI|nr:AtpZ/AtpI family protein [Pedobacter changchengzhani]TDG37849.1 AtpZ/AtpI family protein [Pedobacter changchengzhani]